MNKVLVIAPHPDDETLGCGGSLLRHRKNGDDLYWVICTGMKEKDIREKLMPAHDVWLDGKEAKKLGLCDTVQDMKMK